MHYRNFRWKIVIIFLPLYIFVTFFIYFLTCSCNFRWKMVIISEKNLLHVRYAIQKRNKIILCLICLGRRKVFSKKYCNLFRKLSGEIDDCILETVEKQKQILFVFTNMTMHFESYLIYFFLTNNSKSSCALFFVIMLLQRFILHRVL